MQTALCVSRTPCGDIPAQQTDWLVISKEDTKVTLQLYNYKIKQKDKMSLYHNTKQWIWLGVYEVWNEH